MADLTLTCNKSSAKGGDVLTFTWNPVDSSIYKNFSFVEELASGGVPDKKITISQTSTTAVFPEGISVGRKIHYTIIAEPHNTAASGIIAGVEITALGDSTATITPYNLSVTPTTASQEEKLTFNWQWDPTPIDSIESTANLRAFRLECVDPIGGIVVNKTSSRATLTNPFYNIFFRGYPVDPYYYEYRVYAMSDVGDDAVELGGPSNTVIVYDSRKPVNPGPTPTPGGARLEQFQNSSAENIYPKTIVEGVFRQSDGKTLEELLEESGGSGGVESFNGRTGAVTPQSGDYTAAQVGAVPTSRKVNGQALSGDITLITCGTADLIAGSSRLAAGTLYGVYEG